MASPQQLVKEFPAKALQYVKDQISGIDLFDETKTDLQKDSPWYMLGSIYYLFWTVVLATGALLIALYLPTTTQAYDSVTLLSTGAIGSILRGCHKYGGDGMVIAATLRVYRMWFNAEYKGKGKLTFILGIILLLIAMYSGLTGYLLIWNQRSYWATKIFATFPTYLDITPAHWTWPWDIEHYSRTWLIPNLIGMTTKIIGDYTHEGYSVSQTLTGGVAIGQATMTRFYSLHFAISLILLTISEIYFYTNRKRRINITRGTVFTLLGMLLFVSIIFPTASGTRSNPQVTPLPILSDWYFLALYQLLKYMDPYWATIWTVGIPVVTIGLIFLDWGPERDLWKRPIFFMIGIMGAIEFIAFSALIIAEIANIETDPPFWFASMIFMITIGQFWHWALYRQRLPIMAWSLFHLATSTFYLIFWQMWVDKTFFIWLHVWLHGDPITKPANLYWNLLWFGYSALQLLVALILMWLDRAEKEKQPQQQLTGASAS